MKYDLPTYRGWKVYDVARGRKIESVRLVDGDAQEVVVCDKPVQFNRATGIIVEHRFKFDSLTLDNGTRSIYLTMSIGPCDPMSGKTWHEWISSSKDDNDNDTGPSTLSRNNINKPSSKPHPAPDGIGRSRGIPPVAPPKGRE